MVRLHLPEIKELSVHLFSEPNKGIITICSTTITEDCVYELFMATEQ